MKKTIDVLNKCNDFILISHISPDGDTLGSAAALCLALKSMGKNATLCLDAPVPDKLSFLNKYVSFKRPEELKDKIYECAVAIDTATKLRMGASCKFYELSEYKLNIDHHPTNERFGYENFIVDKASTGELILSILEQMNICISSEIADCLFAAVSTDTNNFVYSSVTSDTFLTAAKLAEAGANISDLCNQIYYQRSYEATKLIAIGLSHLNLHCNGKIATLFMTLDDIYGCGAKREDCDVLVNYAREIKGVEVAAFVNEMPDGDFKISMRSNTNVDVSAISVKYGGGGHKKASGHVMKGNISDVLETIVEDAKCAINEWDHKCN